MISGSTSFSQSTSSGCPWASSSRQDNRTSVESSPGPLADDFLDEVLTLADPDDLAGLRCGRHRLTSLWQLVALPQSNRFGSRLQR